MNNIQPRSDLPPILSDSSEGSLPYPMVMTEDELIHFLRIPEISRAGNYRHVIENLKRKHGLPRIYLCGKTLYLMDSVKHWLQRNVTSGS